MRRFLSFLFFSLFVQGASAADYYWVMVSSPYVATGDSPQAALNKFCTIHPSYSQGYCSPSRHSLTRLSDVVWQVKFYFPGGADVAGTVNIERAGNACPDGYTINTNTNDPSLPTCIPPEPDKCQAKLGQIDSFIGQDLEIEICRAGCGMVIVGADSFKNTVGPKVFYKITAAFTGEKCTGSIVLPEVNFPGKTYSDQDYKCTVTSVVTDENGVRHEESTCVDKRNFIDNRPCASETIADINGVSQCVQNGTGPKATENKDDVKLHTKQNPDGSKTDTKTTTSTVTNCIGAKACTTSTSTSVSSTVTNADGTPGGSTSTCTGDNCPKGDGKGNGDSKGDGKGDEGDGEGPCNPSKQYCGQAPSIQLLPGESGNFDEGNAVWDQNLVDIKTELDEKIEQYSSSFKGLFDINLGSGGGALPCDTVNVSFGRFGSTSLRLCLNDYAEQLSYLRYALLLAASVIAALVVLRD